jgi:hypothetical protein
MSKERLNFRQKVYNLRRKLFGTIEYRDPRPEAARSPYTFWLPPADRLDLLKAGDIVKVMIASVPQGVQFDCERMWCIIDRMEDDTIFGELDNQPFDIPQLKSGDKLQFKIWHIIDYIYRNGDEDDRDRDAHLPDMEEKQIWDRCLVDAEILEGNARVGYIYREEPDMTKDGDKYPDSGWRIRADVRQLTDEQYENPTPEYIAIGKVLNEDDSWLHLIDAPVGAKFLRNSETGEYEETE